MASLALDERSGSVADVTPVKRRKLSATKQNNLLHDILGAQFENTQLLVAKLKEKKSLLTFQWGIIDSGCLEEAFNRRMAGEDNGLAKLAPTPKFLKQTGPYGYGASSVGRMAKASP